MRSSASPARGREISWTFGRQQFVSPFSRPQSSYVNASITTSLGRKLEQRRGTREWSQRSGDLIHFPRNKKNNLYSYPLKNAMIQNILTEPIERTVLRE